MCADIDKDKYTADVIEFITTRAKAEQAAGGAAPAEAQSKL